MQRRGTIIFSERPSVLIQLQDVVNALPPRSDIDRVGAEMIMRGVPCGYPSPFLQMNGVSISSKAEKLLILKSIRALNPIAASSCWSWNFRQGLTTSESTHPVKLLRRLRAQASPFSVNHRNSVYIRLLLCALQDQGKNASARRTEEVGKA
jgi:hypothetical protein